MSLKIKIDNKQLELLQPKDLIQIFNNNSDYFRKKEYLIERYNREQEIDEVINQNDDTEIKVFVNIEGQLVDTATGYAANKPITYYDKNDENFILRNRKNMNGRESTFIEKVDEQENNLFLEMLLELFKENDTYLLDNDIMKHCLTYSSTDEMVFIDKDTNEIMIKEITDDCITFYEDNILEKKIGFARRIKSKNPINLAIENRYELYTEKKQITFSEKDYKVKLLEYGGLITNPIPFIRYDFGKSLIENLLSEIRAYELVTNNMKKVLNYNDESILIIPDHMLNVEETAIDNQIDGENVKVDNPYEKAKKIIGDIKSNGALFVDSSSDGNQEIKWLIKDVNDNANENHKKNLKEDIYNVAGTYNPSSDNMVYQNTLSLMFKLYGLETKVGRYCQIIRKGQLERIYLITNLFNTMYNTNYNYKNIDMNFTRDLPTNMNEELNFANQLNGIVSRETIYEMLSFIDNPKKELQKWKDWELELAKLEAEKSKIISESTVDDMKPERLLEKNLEEE